MGSNCQSSNQWQRPLTVPSDSTAFRILLPVTANICNHEHFSFLQYTAHSVAKEKDILLEGIDFDVAGTFDVRGYLGVGDAPPYLQKVKLHAHVKTSADQVGDS